MAARVAGPEAGEPGPGDAWFDDPDASQLATDGPVLRPFTVAEVSGVTLSEVHARLADLESYSLLRRCELVVRDGALYVVVPSELTEAVRSSAANEELPYVLGALPVHFRVR